MTKLIHIKESALVHAPGHLYSPLGAEVEPKTEEVRPGRLIPSERQFVVDLIRFLDPKLLANRSMDDPLPSPIVCNNLEYVLVRNIDQLPSAFRLRMNDADHWFYPDFLLWITDRTRPVPRQTLCLIDPKGLHEGLPQGWADNKLLSLLYKLREIEAACAPDGNVTLTDGETMEFRLRGALVSVSPLQLLQTDAQFRLAAGRPSACRNTFEAAGIFFQDQDRDQYIAKLLEFLTDDSCEIVRLMDDVRCNTGHCGKWFRQQLARSHSTESTVLGNLLENTLPAQGEPFDEGEFERRLERLVGST